MLRDYQQAAHDSAIDFIKKCVDPCVIEAATGAGKSHIIAAIAETMHDISKGKKILCLAPSAELVVQNHGKYIATGNPASMFSASVGSVCSRHPVVFGTPGTVKNRIRRFGAEFCCVIIDECHRITPTIIEIIETIKECNPMLRVIGLSATPYRLGSGYVYQLDENNKPNGEDKARNPYFMKKVFTVGAKNLIDRGFLTQPVIGAINTASYETIAMQLNSMGQFNKVDIDQAYHGQGRKTAAIIADVVSQAKERHGVMIFAATVQHAKECMQSLPPGLSAIVTGTTNSKERPRILTAFKAREIKYLVNVSVLTTGFDAPHVDLIAILRATESVSLLQQIIGRGLRIDDGKEDCLVLDYAENLERHCPDGDIFDPKITTTRESGGSACIEASCPFCNSVNEFTARQNDDGFDISEEGYFLDLEGSQIETQFGPMPAHYGRRCTGMIKDGASYTRCAYRWTVKKCPHCDGDNDIAARYCCDCKGELVDPNEKLRIDFKALKRDPTQMQTDKVLNWVLEDKISKTGNDMIVVTYTTPYRSFRVWYTKKYLKTYGPFMDATGDATTPPQTITYKKDITTGFYRIYAYNQEADHCEDESEDKGFWGS